jgi:hypothetical protein
MPSADALSETKACDLLARVFRKRGYDIVRNIPFNEFGVSFHIDGWDDKARVGFEFLSSEDEDHDDLTLKEYQTLMAAQVRGDLAIFVIDEVEPFTSDDLRGAAEEFLDAVAAAELARRKSARKKAKKSVAKAKKSVAKAKKSVAKKRPVLKERVATKSAAVTAGRKPLAKKRTNRKAR